MSFVSPAQLSSGAKRSTALPSGSRTLAYRWPQNASQGSLFDSKPAATIAVRVSSTPAAEKRHDEIMSAVTIPIASRCGGTRGLYLVGWRT